MIDGLDDGVGLGERCCPDGDGFREGQGLLGDALGLIRNGVFFQR